MQQCDGDTSSDSKSLLFFFSPFRLCSTATARQAANAMTMLWWQYGHGCMMGGSASVMTQQAAAPQVAA